MKLFNLKAHTLEELKFQPGNCYNKEFNHLDKKKKNHQVI